MCLANDQNARDFEADPYDRSERRVAAYLDKLMNEQIGVGDDPIQFLISSHGILRVKCSETLSEQAKLMVQCRVLLDEQHAIHEMLTRLIKAPDVAAREAVMAELASYGVTQGLGR